MPSPGMAGGSGRDAGRALLARAHAEAPRGLERSGRLCEASGWCSARRSRRDEASSSTTRSSRCSRSEETLVDHRPQEGEQGLVVARHVEDAHGFVVVAYASPGPGLEELVQGADAARQGEEGVGEIVHPRLALVHVRGDDELGELHVVHELVELPGNHARHGRLQLARVARARMPIVPTSPPP